MPTEAIQHLEEQLDQLVTDQTAAPVENFLEEHYGLPGNPFSPNGIADASGENPPLRPDDYAAVLDFIITGYRTKQRQMMILKGDYGTGKTHTLRFIEQLVNTRMSKGDHGARAIYVERPRIEAHELNRSILRSLGYDTIKKYLWFIVREALANDIAEGAEIFTRIRNGLLASTTGKRKGAPAGGLWDESDPSLSPLFGSLFAPDTLRDHRTFFANLAAKGFRREELRPYFIDLLLKAMQRQSDFELGQMFVALLLAQDEAKLSSWEALTIFTGVKDPPPPAMFLQFLLEIMKLNGVAYVYLLLDEFEEVPQGQLLTGRQRQEYLYTVREVLNKIPSGLSIVMGISPAGWDALARLATPLADANDNTVDLRPIALDDAVSIANYYFKRIRQGSRFENRQDILPLTHELIAHIHDHFPKSAQTTARNWIQFFHILLDRVAENRIDPLSVQEIQTILDEFGSMKASGMAKSGTIR